MPRCVIINCNSPINSSPQRQGHISYHSFPHNPYIKEKWIAATGRKDWFPTKHSTICSIHFENTSFIEGKKLRLLKKTAYPTIDILKFIDNDDENKDTLQQPLSLSRKRKLEKDVNELPTSKGKIVTKNKLLTKIDNAEEKNNQKNKIGTHDGVFHCDEVLACFMLKSLPQYENATIIRTRDMAKLSECDIVVDVGAEFDHKKKRYDHHQREFTETLSSIRPELGDKFKIKLSSAGLVYSYYGEDVIKQLTPRKVPLTSHDLGIIYKKVYETFIEEIDAIDNGVPMTTEEPKYKIRTHLSSRVGRLNPEWNSKQEADLDEIFQKAMVLVGEEFIYNVNYYISVWLPARDYVKSALEKRNQIHKSGQIIEFTERFPWKEHLFDLETEMDLSNEIKYVIFNDKPNSWRVQAVPVTPASFVARKPLHKAWWGVRDELLSGLAGIDGCIFCHSTGFIAGNTSRDGALKMAIASLEAE